MDRNIMRVAVYELIHCEDIPPKVSINEAIDIGKKYGTQHSAAFINGILDGVNIALNRDTGDGRPVVPPAGGERSPEMDGAPGGPLKPRA
jgi:hypothetical protein